MEGFTLALALVDAIPVLFFGASMILIAIHFTSWIFIVGAILSTLAGCGKVLWKMLLVIRKKDIHWLNKPFVPMQATGFVLMLLSFILGFRKINFADLWSTVTAFPCVVFFAVWLTMMGVMVWYRKNRFDDNSAKANWTAQIINSVAQISLFIGIIFAR